MCNLDVGADPGQGPLAILGDTQRTMCIEQLLGKESNDIWREDLLRGLAEERPAAAMIVGDIVCLGASATEWRYFDRIVARLRASGTAIVAVLGNHDYYGPNRRAVALAAKRFPMLRQHRWFVWRFGALALLCLDSNRWDLGRRQWAAQLQWLGDMLARLDQDTGVRGVLLLCHHPPFCNTFARRESIAVRRDFLTLYLQAAKAMGVISGHAHTYEHLLVDGHDYIVTGGGGGPCDAVCLPPHEKYRSLYRGPALRDLHYLRVDVEADAVRITVKALSPAAPALRVIDRFQLAWTHPARHGMLCRTWA